MYTNISRPRILPCLEGQHASQHASLHASLHESLHERLHERLHESLHTNLHPSPPMTTSSVLPLIQRCSNVACRNFLLPQHLLRAIQTQRGKRWMAVSWILMWPRVFGLPLHLQRARLQAVTAVDLAAGHEGALIARGGDHHPNDNGVSEPSTSRRSWKRLTGNLLPNLEVIDNAFSTHTLAPSG